MKLFCFGLGYTAQNLINELSQSKWQYSGTHRSSGDLIFDGLSPLKNAKNHLKDVTHLLISIAPDKNGQDPVLLHHQHDILEMPNLKWIGYLSATSVYGNHNGSWVNEKTPLSPSDSRGISRIKAEQKWLSIKKVPVHIFRLGGIYGIGRNQINKVLDKTAQKIIKEEQVFSRIHIVDICSAIIASFSKPHSDIYNIVDDVPSSASDVLDYICDILNEPRLKAIAFQEADLSPMMKSFYADNKRVSNSHAKETLPWKLKFPSYKEGYSDILSKLNNSPS